MTTPCYPLPRIPARRSGPTPRRTGRSVDRLWSCSVTCGPRGWGLSARVGHASAVGVGPNGLTRRGERRWPGELLARSPSRWRSCLCRRRHWPDPGNPALSITVAAVILLNAVILKDVRVQVISAARPELIHPFTELRPAQFRQLVRLVAVRGGDQVADGRPGRQRALDLSHQVLLVARYWRTNLTMRQIGPLFGVSHPAAHRVIDTLGPLLALAPARRRLGRTAELEHHCPLWTVGPTGGYRMPVHCCVRRPGRGPTRTPQSPTAPGPAHRAWSSPG